MLKRIGKALAAVGLAIWLFLQGFTQIWGGFSDEPIPAFLIRHNLLAVSVHPEIIGWGSLTVGTALMLLLFVESPIPSFVRRRWRATVNPSLVEITAHGGRGKASLQLRHSGEPTTYRVEGRIESLLGSLPNPAPQTFNAEIQPGADSGGAFEQLLVDGQFAHIIVADMRDRRTDWGGSITFEVRRGKYNSTCVVPDSGALMHYVIRYGDTKTERRYKVYKNKDPMFIDIEQAYGK